MDKEGMARKIKSLREEKKLTREKLGEGFSKGYINKLESGEINPTIDKLDLISKRLDVSLDYLVGNDNCKAKNCSSTCDHLFIRAFSSLFSREYMLADNYIAKLLERLETMDKEESDFVYLMAGVLSFRLKRYENAIESLSKIVSASEPVNSLSLLFLARSYSHAGDLDMSLSIYNKLLKNEHIADTDYNLIYLESLYHFAYTLILDKRFEDAKGIALKYQELCINTDHRDRVLEVYDILGAAELSMKNFSEAAHYFRMEYAGYKIINDISGLAMSCNHLAEVYSQTNRPEKAMKYYQKSISYYRETGNKKYISYNLRSIAELLFKQGKPEEALIYANSALKVLDHEDIYENDDITAFIDEIKSAIKG